MINPFYADLGLAKETVGAVRSSVGLAASIAGVAFGGLSAVRWASCRRCWWERCSVRAPTSRSRRWPCSSRGWKYLPPRYSSTTRHRFRGRGTGQLYVEPDQRRIPRHAVRPAQLYALLGKAVKGLSGVMVEALAAGSGLMNAYALFFAGSALVGVPALFLVWLLTRRLPAPPPASASSAKT